MEKDLCSITISRNLKELGFKGLTCCHYSNKYDKYKKLRREGCIRNWNDHFVDKLLHLISVPTVDEAIDWIRRKYNVVIYSHVPPFVDPKDKQNRIIYIYDVKYCDRKNGWNSRIYISYSKCKSYNIYSAKRMAIMDAIRWIKKNKTCSKKTKK